MSILFPQGNSIVLSCSNDEFIVPATGKLTYEVIPIPVGPGIDQLERVMTHLPPLDFERGPWIAGGSVRRLLQGENLDSGDIDIFFPDHASWKFFSDVLSSYEIVVKTKKATTFLVEGLKVQIIRRAFYKTLIDVFKDFDFTVCQIASDGKNIACTKQAHLDIMDQVLRLATQGKISKHTLVQRMSKYVNYGIFPEPGLFEIIIKSGLDYTSAYSIFSESDVAIYDCFTGETSEDNIPSDSLNEGVLRTIARKLGLEKEND